MKRVPCAAFIGLAVSLLSLPAASEARGGRGGGASFSRGAGGFGGHRGGFGGFRGSIGSSRVGFSGRHFNRGRSFSGRSFGHGSFGHRSFGHRSFGRHFPRHRSFGHHKFHGRFHKDRSVFLVGGFPFFSSFYSPFYEPFYQPVYYPPVAPYPVSERVVYIVEDTPSRLERVETSPPARSTLEFLRDEVSVRALEGDRYRLQWLGSTRELAAVEFRALDAQGKALDSEITREAPYRAELRIPEEADRVEIVVRQRGGTSLTFRLTRVDFLSLTRK